MVNASARVGWRVWRAYRHDESPVQLHSPISRGTLAPPARVTGSALCDLVETRHTDPAPAPDCLCGWYALRSWAEARYVLCPRGWDDDDDYDSWYECLYELLVYTLVAVLPPYVEHRDGWRARQVALLAVVDWPPPPTDQSDLIVVWRAAIARAYGVPLISPEIAVREFGAAE